MRFTVHQHPLVINQLNSMVEQMQAWTVKSKITPSIKQDISKRITFFKHTTQVPPITVAGADGSGDFPALTYEDSFVYLTTAEVARYKSNDHTGLEELEVKSDPVYALTWVPEDPVLGPKRIDETFELMTGMTVMDLIKASDYHSMKSKLSQKTQSPNDLHKNLIRPHASDTGNLGIQFRTTAELSAILRTIQKHTDLTYILSDGTFSLPMVWRSGGSLFFEHVKRLCCNEATSRGIGFFALSKSPGLPAMDVVESIAAEKANLNPGQIAEHWFLRLPHSSEQWKFPLADHRRISPPGAVSYLYRPHRSTGVLRLDVDEAYWSAYLSTPEGEKDLFEKLDYVGHDQRAYGYPYPIKSAHDRVSLTNAERIAIRKSIIASAVKAGMKRRLFYDPSIATGHK